MDVEEHGPSLWRRLALGGVHADLAAREGDAADGADADDGRADGYDGKFAKFWVPWEGVHGDDVGDVLVVERGVFWVEAGQDGGVDVHRGHFFSIGNTTVGSDSDYAILLQTQTEQRRTRIEKEAQETQTQRARLGAHHG